jgi:hypothetical protein
MSRDPKLKKGLVYTDRRIVVESKQKITAELEERMNQSSLNEKMEHWRSSCHGIRCSNERLVNAISAELLCHDAVALNDRQRDNTRYINLMNNLQNFNAPGCNLSDKEIAAKHDKLAATIKAKEPSLAGNLERSSRNRQCAQDIAHYFHQKEKRFAEQSIKNKQVAWNLTPADCAINVLLDLLKTRSFNAFNMLASTSTAFSAAANMIFASRRHRVVGSTSEHHAPDTVCTRMIQVSVCADLVRLQFTRDPMHSPTQINIIAPNVGATYKLLEDIQIIDPHCAPSGKRISIYYDPSNKSWYELAGCIVSYNGKSNESRVQNRSLTLIQGKPMKILADGVVFDTVGNHNVPLYVNFYERASSNKSAYLYSAAAIKNQVTGEIQCRLNEFRRPTEHKKDLDCIFSQVDGVMAMRLVRQPPLGS